MERIPLHPGTHLTEMRELKKLESEWHAATPQGRLAIVQNIWYEIEAFGDIYRMEVDDGPSTD
jgi:hypothetical protein